MLVIIGKFVILLIHGYTCLFFWKLARMRKDLENVQMEENVQMMILCSSICAIPTLPLSRSVTAVRHLNHNRYVCVSEMQPPSVLCIKQRDGYHLKL